MQSKTAKLMSELNSLARIDAIPAARARELVRMYDRDKNVTDVIAGLWTDFSPEHVNEIEEVSKRLATLE